MCIKQVLRAYWDRLEANISKRQPEKSEKNAEKEANPLCGMNFADFYRLYKSGIDRWLWFFPFMAYFDGCTKGAQKKAKKEAESW